MSVGLFIYTTEIYAKYLQEGRAGEVGLVKTG